MDTKYYGKNKNACNSLLFKLGAECQNFRIDHGYTQREIAFDTGYTKELISSFERGLNNNAFVFFWYVKHGFNVVEFMEKYRGEI